MSMSSMTMEPSNSMLQTTKSRRRRRLGRPLLHPEMRKVLQEGVISKCLEPEEEGSTLIQRIPPQVLAESLSATFRKKTLPLLTSLPMMPSRPLQQTGLNTSRCLRLKHSIAFLMLSGTAITTVQAIRQNSLVGQSVGLSLRSWQALLGATVLYVAFAQSMHQ
uniref:Uncharacterized protein n=1 Tax=Cherry necrotic rusty mottle virus TaxID=129143 RepID=M9QXQ2_9VIRU|nr:hypothetical protein [Cherry necrotic rusty mottle virus]